MMPFAYTMAWEKKVGKMQIIKYKWHEWAPQLVLRNAGSMETIKLMDSELDFELGKKTCIGFFRGNKHFPCKNQRETEERHCNECKLEDDYFLCVRCDGSGCANTKKRNECQKSYYYIYLAAFDSTMKVGISYEHRIMERLVEQGADFGAKIARVQDGKLVREMEQKIKKEINIVDRLTGLQKSKLIFGNPNVSVANILKAVSMLRTNDFAKYMIRPEIYDLREYYNLGRILSHPEVLDANEGERVKGNVVSAKGNLIILKKDEKFFAINAHSLLGRDIRF
jgi:Protein of unknown function (DUF2797)